MVSKKRIHYLCEDGIEKSPFVIMTNSDREGRIRVMTNGDSKGRIFLSHPHIHDGFL